MARPQKQTVDYFPHRCKHGKTMFILEAHYGDKGYVLWFKTLELLGSTTGHSYDFDNAEQCQYFLAYCRTDKKQAVAILDLLADLEAIDKDLWTKQHIIWSHNFIEGIQPVYRNRALETPPRPVMTTRNAVTGTRNGVSDVGYTQSRVEYSRVEKSREKETMVSDIILPNGIKQETWNEFLEMRWSLKAPLKTLHAQQLILNRLTEFQKMGQDPNEVLNQSIMNSWKGVFELKGGGNGKRENQSVPGNRPAGAFSDIESENAQV